MSFPKVRGLLTRESNRIAAILVMLFLVGTQSSGTECKAFSEIWSNNMRLLAGNGDTLWVASLGSSQVWGVNYSLNRGEKWQGYSLGCLESGVASIAFGKGTFLALQHPGNDRTVSTVWTYSHANAAPGSFTIKWHDSVMASDSIATGAVNAVYAGDRFYFACRNGGVAFRDPQNNTIRASLPGDTVPFDPNTDFRAQHPRFGSTGTTVYSVDRFQSDSGIKILALTEPKLWFCNTTLTSWDSSITAVMADSTLVFKGFGYAFISNAVPAGTPPVLYAAINYSRPSAADTIVSLFRYRFGKGRWTLVLKEAPRAITPASRGFLYTATGANQMAGYRDSVADTAMVPATGLTPLLSDADFITRMYTPGNLTKPDSIQDLLFVKKSDSSGNFYVATSGGTFSSDGLYSSYNERPGVTSDTFRLDRHAKEIKSGLGETYALPGILSDSYLMSGTSKTTFIYRLSRNARVTIKIYDYNMQHVKTVIDNESRNAMPTGRSTDVNRDTWDATTFSGRPVAPGIYYYKITTSTGERAFGKIVVAKGRTE